MTWDRRNNIIRFETSKWWTVSLIFLFHSQTFVLSSRISIPKSNNFYYNWIVNSCVQRDNKHRSVNIYQPAHNFSTVNWALKLIFLFIITLLTLCNSTSPSDGLTHVSWYNFCFACQKYWNFQMKLFSCSVGGVFFSNPGII